MGEMLFLQRGMLPNDEECNEIFCDLHEELCKQQKLLPISERCASFCAGDDGANKHAIYKNDFYFSCIHCHEFDQCNLCTLIRAESKMRKEYENTQIECQQSVSPQCSPCKRQSDVVDEDECKEASMIVGHEQEEEENECDQIKQALEEEQLKNERICKEFELERQAMNEKYECLQSELV